MASKKFVVIFFYLFEIYIGIHWNSVNGQIEDSYSSIPALEEIFETEKYLVKNLDDYIETSKLIKIDLVKSFLKYWHIYHNKFKKITANELTLNNSLQILSFKKKFSSDFQILQNHLEETTKKMAEKFSKPITEHRMPNLSDLEGVTSGLLRIQEMYDISAKDIANGVLRGIDFGKKFTAFDCFKVGLKLGQMDYFYYAIEWYKMAIERVKDEGWKGIMPEIDVNVIVNHLTLSQYAEGSLENAKLAVETTLQALDTNSDNKIVVELVEDLKLLTEHYANLRLQVAPKELSNNKPYGSFKARHDGPTLDYLKKACCNELKKTPEEERQLFCEYETRNHPFLLIAPIKIEILNLSPRLILAHEIIYDSEIEIIKKNSKKHLKRSYIWNAEKERGEPTEHRTNKNALFENETHPLAHTLYQRVYDISGLTMETSEPFVAMNYGIGGHYDLHPDYFEEPDEERNITPYMDFEWGNRIATTIFYLSDVPLGGSTVWPYIQVSIAPKKGTAVFWYNLFADGTSDYKSMHAACPIIVGSKWILTTWTRIAGQIFLKPCNLIQDGL